jgi:2-iminobutanoate/2-iminopropanoate deaminase
MSVTGIASPYSWDSPFHYSQATIHNGVVYVSGQAALDASGAIVGEGDFEAQAHQVFANLKTVLAAAGSDLSKVFKVNIYVTDMTKFPTIVECREKYFSKPYPADTTVEVTALAIPGLLLEIDVIAALN